MDGLSVLAYGGIAVLVILLVVFEMKEGFFGRRTPRGGGYEYYTVDNSCVRIHKAFGSLYKVYVHTDCPVPTKQDRFGSYFPVRARSASEAEYIIDNLYRREGADVS